MATAQHTFTNPIPDDAAFQGTRPSHWNADHTVTLGTDENFATDAQVDKWEDHADATGNPHATYIDELADVVAPTPTIGDMLIWDGTAWVNSRQIGDGTNYIEFEADGTMRANGSATCWDDIATSIAAEKVVGTTRAVMSNGFALYRMGVNDSAEFDAQEVSHAYKQGSEIEFHVHWVVDDTTPDVGDSWVRWRVEFSYITHSAASSPFPVYSAIQTIEGQTMIPGNTTAMSELTTNVGTLLDTNMLMGSRIMMRVKRIAATGAGTTTAPSVNPYLAQVGIHIERDTAGSRTEYTK